MGLIQKLTPGVTYQQELLPDLGCASQCCGTKYGHEKSSKYWLNFWPGEGLWNEVFPALTINKDVTDIHNSSPSNVNFWAQGKQCLLTATELPPQAAITPYSEQGTKEVNNHITECWRQIAEMCVKGMITVSPGSCIFPYIKKVLNSLRYLVFLN